MVRCTDARSLSSIYKVLRMQPVICGSLDALMYPSVDMQPAAALVFTTFDKCC